PAASSSIAAWSSWTRSIVRAMGPPPQNAPPQSLASPAAASRRHDREVSDQPDDAELERLGLYDPKAEDAEDRLRGLRNVLELGATVEEIANAHSLTDLVLDLAIRPPGETQDLDTFVESSELDPNLLRQLW